MRIDQPAQELLPSLRRLWQEAFGDGEPFLDRFYSLCYSPDRCRCVIEDGAAVSALYWYDASFRGEKMAYLYAVATLNSCRRRGFCRTLMEDAHRILREQGYAGVLLSPSGEGPEKLYGSLGYTWCCTRDTIFARAGGDALPMKKIGREEYAGLRRNFLPDDGLVQDGPCLVQLDGEADFYFGGDWLLAAARDDQGPVGTELLGNREKIPGILAALGMEEGYFRTPGKREKNGMFLPLRSDVPTPGYLGLILD